MHLEEDGVIQETRRQDRGYDGSYYDAVVG